MRARDVRLPIDIPERLGVIAREVEMDSIRPRGLIVRIFTLEDDLEHGVSFDDPQATQTAVTHIVPSRRIILGTVVVNEGGHQPESVIVEPQSRRPDPASHSMSAARLPYLAGRS